MNLELWATLDAFNFNAYVAIGVKAIAAIVAAIIGYIVGGPIVGVLSRLAFHRPPALLATWAGKLVSAGIAGCLAWLLVNLGMGGGLGFGLGPGMGGGAGLGPGKGGNGTGTNGGAITKNDGIEVKDPSGKIGPPPKPPREVVQVVMLGGEKYPGGGRYYVVNRKGEVDPKDAITLDDVEKFFDKNKERLELQIVLTQESVAKSHRAVQVLQQLAQKYEFPSVILEQ